VSSSFDNTLKIWDAESATELTTLIGHESRVNYCCWNKDGTSIASVSDDGTIKIWNPLSSTELDTLIGHGGPIRNACFGDNHQIITASDDKTSRLWEISTQKPENSYAMEDTVKVEKQSLTGHSAQINDLRVSANGQYLVSASDDGTCRVWNLQTLHSVRVFTNSEERPYSSCDIFENQVAIVTDLGLLSIYDLKTGAEIVKDYPLAENNKPITRIRFTSSGTHILAGGWNNKVVVFGVKNKVVAPTGIQHNDWIVGLDSSNNRKYVASCGWDEKCIVYNGNIGNHLNQSFILAGHTNAVSSVAFSPDNRLIATSSFDGSVKLWNLQNGSLLLNIVGHKGRVNCVSFISQMDNLVVSGSEDRYVKFFDFNSGHLLNEFVCQGPVSALHAVRPQGQPIVMVAGDKIGNLYFTQLVKPGEY